MLCDITQTLHMEMGGADLHCKDLRNQKTFEQHLECAVYFKLKHAFLKSTKEIPYPG